MKIKKKPWIKITAVWLICCLCIGITTPLLAKDAKTTNPSALRVAYYPLEGFFGYDQNGNPIGYGVELLNAISRCTGLAFTYVPADSWEETKQMLLDDEADIRMPGTLPAKPSETLEYTSNSVIETYYAVMALKTRTDLYYEDYEAFGDLKVGISKGLYQAADMAEQIEAVGLEESQLIFYDEYNDCREGLQTGEVDAIISNIMDLDTGMKQLEKFDTMSNYISMKKNAPALAQIDEALSSLKQTEPSFLSDLYKFWFPDRVVVPLTRQETEYLQQMNQITFSFRDGQGYLSTADGEGGFRGFYPMLAQNICEKLDKTCSQSDLFGEESKGIVVYTGFDYDYSWADKLGMDITQPYQTVNYYRISKKDRQVDTRSCKVAAIEKFHALSVYLEENYDSSQLVYYKDYRECIDAVNRGEADITYVNRYVSEYYLGMYRYSGLTAALIDYSTQICLAVSGDTSGMLAPILGKMLLTFTSEDMEKMMLSCTTQTPQQNLIFEMLYKNPLQSAALVGFFVALLVICLALVFFARRIQKKNIALANATNARQEFLSRMSHDMRTPMNAVIGFSGFAQESETLEEAREYAGKIEDAGKYLLQLINDSLDYNKLSDSHYELKLEPYKNTDFVHDMDTLLSQKAREKNITVELQFDEDGERTLLFDKLRIQQIFMNLLNNSIKFTPQGGRISFRISHEEPVDGRVLVHFIVQDNGIGMSREFVQKKLFEPFEQEHQEGRQEAEHGTGLGLSIVKQLVDKMGGTIRCESELGRGTTFYVDLYGQVTEEVIAQKEQVQKEMSQLRGRRVLLCEDHPMNREIADRLLQKKGILVENAIDGQDGVDQFEASEQGHFDAILMDIRMPVLDGIEATKKIRHLDRRDAARIPIIALSANTLEEDVSVCRAAGMNAHLGKPIEPQKLYEVLAEFIP